MKAILRFLIVALAFFSEFGVAKPINRPLGSREYSTVGNEISETKISQQTRQHQFTSLQPKEFLGKEYKPGDIFSINFKGKSHSIEFDKIVYIDNDNVVHWVGHTAGNPDKKVIFVIEKDSIFGNQADNLQPSFNMAGVVETGNETIRIRPTGNRNTHILYTQTENQKSRNLSLSDGKADRQAKFLEAKIKQFKFLSQFDSDNYNVGIQGTITKIKNLPEGFQTSPIFGESKKDRPKEVDEVLSKLLENYPVIGSETYEFKQTRILVASATRANYEAKVMAS